MRQLHNFIEIHDPQKWKETVQGKLAEGFDPLLLSQHDVDAHYVCIGESNEAEARCSLWWQQVPAYESHRLGVIGHFASISKVAAQSLLAHVYEILKNQNCTLAVGPMDGNTWRSYRCVTESNSERPFFLEPNTPAEWPDYFTAADFKPMAHYSSALNSDLSHEDPRVARAALRLKDNGVVIRSLNKDHINRDLDFIYDVSIASFGENFLYTPITREEFHGQYQKVLPYLDPRLTLIAELQDRPIGFVFGLPDMAQKLRGETMDTFIVKTVAVCPGRVSAGLGSVLVDQVQRIAHQLGYKRAIHALMHDANRSRNLSGHYAETIRGYTLYSKPLI